MKDHHHFKYTNAVLLVPLVLVLAIWIVFWVEIRFHYNFNDLGIFPRTILGLRGVFFGPFIHSSLEHLYNNTVPIAILSSSLVYFYRASWLKIVLIGILLCGVLTWCIGRSSYHIGISGLIYVLASYIFFKGVFTKYYRLVALSLSVVFIYGSLLWYIFPVKDSISWEGHLSGFITGVLLAFFVKTKIPSIKKYDWEKDDYREDEDEFLRHFDEKGNFIETIPQDEPLDVKVTYHYLENDKTKKDL